MNEAYKKWLLVSDIDGTLNTKSLKLPEKNRTAIQRYVDNGGNFTLSSGRNLPSLQIHYKKLGIDTPAIFLNGAGIYDFKERKIIYENPITPEGEEIILDVLKKHKFAQLTVFSPETIYLTTRKCLYGYIVSRLDNLDYKLCKRVSDLPRGVWGKVCFFGGLGLIKELKTIFKSEENQELFECFNTSPFTLEVVNKGVNKGTAVLKLAEILNVEKSNTAAVGDYYNDVDMFKRVGHPVCCGQAPDDIKEMCEHVTCHCNNGAVADFINYIETKYIK